MPEKISYLAFLTARRVGDVSLNSQTQQPLKLPQYASKKSFQRVRILVGAEISPTPRNKTKKV